MASQSMCQFPMTLRHWYFLTIAIGASAGLIFQQTAACFMGRPDDLVAVPFALIVLFVAW